jgi:hypothetical protein
VVYSFENCCQLVVENKRTKKRNLSLEVEKVFNSK